MRKYLDFEYANSWELSPLTFEEFERLGRWNGSPDIAFEQWKRHNQLYELDRLSSDPIPRDRKGLRIEDGEPMIDWKYCEDAWWI